MYRFADLDNTILFSKKYGIEKKVVVEYRDGEIQGLVDKEVYELLQQTNKREFIPITSRSIKQYNRIKFYADNGKPYYALVNNGGNLVLDGLVDCEWKQETYKLITNDNLKINELIYEFCPKEALYEWQDEMVLYLKNIEDEEWNTIKEIFFQNGLMCYSHGKKRYICSNKINKGNSIKRFMSRFGVEKSIAIGDSEVDITMLGFVDKMILNKELEKHIQNKENVIFVEKKDLGKAIFK